MSESILDNINQERRSREREVVLEALSKPSRSHMTLGVLMTEIGEHPDYGPIVMSLTLDELRAKTAVASPGPSEEAKTASPGTSKKSTSKKKSSAKSAKSAKVAAADESSSRARIDWEKAQADILAFMKAAGEPVSTGDISKEVKINGAFLTPVQARKALASLLEAEKVSTDGSGRGTTWSVA